MTINSVSFRSTTPSTFQDIINKPQTYKAPISAYPLEGDKKKSSTGKKVAIGLLATAAVATGLVFGHRTGKLKVWGEAIAKKFPQLKDVPNKVMGGLDKAGKTLNGWGETAIKKGQELWASLSAKLPKMGQEATENASEAVEEIVEEVVEEVANAPAGIEKVAENIIEVTEDMIQ